MKNSSISGDVVRIITASGNPVANYTYNAWGEVISSGGTLKDINPLRYRGYYYDIETGLYYLNSRYYDPATCRFINADGQINPSFLGLNLFTYCENNPVMFFDRTGNNSEAFAGWASTMWWLTALDGPLPIGDIIFVAGLIVTGGAAVYTSFPTIEIMPVDINLPSSKTTSTTTGSTKTKVTTTNSSSSSKPKSSSNTNNGINSIRSTIPKKILTPDGSRVDLTKFNNPRGPKGPKGNRGILGPLGYYILKDLDQHKGSIWKLFDWAGRRIASLAGDGSIVGK